MEHGARWIVILPLAVVLGVILLAALGRFMRYSGGHHAAGFAALVMVGLTLAILLVSRSQIEKQHPAPTVIEVMPDRTTKMASPDRAKMADAAKSSDNAKPADGSSSSLSVEQPPGDGEVRRWLADAYGNGRTVAERPNWLNEPARDAGGTYRAVVHTGLTSLPGELKQKLDQQLTAAGAELVRDKFGEEAVSRLPLSPAYLLQQKIAEYKEKHNPVVSGDAVPVTDEWVLLELKPEALSEIESRWHKLLVATRLIGTAGCCAGVLALLAAVFGFLKLGEMKDPTRRRRLQVAASVIIMAAVVTAVYLARGGIAL